MSEEPNLAERALRAQAAFAAAGAPWVPPEVALAVSRPDGSVDADDLEGARPAIESPPFSSRGGSAGR